MKTFRCPKCKNEVSETKFIHIKEMYCRPCKMPMVALYEPKKTILAIEKKISKLIAINPKIVVTPKFIEMFK